MTQGQKVLGQNYTLAPVPWEVLGQMSPLPYGVGTYGKLVTDNWFLQPVKNWQSNSNWPEVASTEIYCFATCAMVGYWRA